MSSDTRAARIVAAVHGRQRPTSAACVEPLVGWLRTELGYDGLNELYGRFAHGTDRVSALMREAIWRAAAHRADEGLSTRRRRAGEYDKGCAQQPEGEEAGGGSQPGARGASDHASTAFLREGEDIHLPPWADHDN